MSTVNPWKKFAALLPGGARTVVTVTTNHGDGTSTVTLRNGSTMRVKGESVAPPDKALVVDGEIRRKVPSLPQHAASV